MSEKPHRVRVPHTVYQFAMDRLDRERKTFDDLTDPEARERYAVSVKRLRDFLAEATEVHDFA